MIVAATGHFQIILQTALRRLIWPPKLCIELKVRTMIGQIQVIVNFDDQALSEATHSLEHQALLHTQSICTCYRKEKANANSSRYLGRTPIERNYDTQGLATVRFV